MPRSYAISDEARAGRQAQKQATRDALLAAAQRLYALKGFDNTSVTEIGKEAGVSHTLINTYFGGKAGLLAAVVQTNNAPQLHAIRAIVAEQADPITQLRAVLQTCADHDLKDRRLFSVLQSTSWTWDAQAEIKNRADLGIFTAQVAGLVQRARDEGLATGNIAPADVAEAVFAIYTWGMRRALFDALLPADAISRLWPQVAAVAGFAPDLPDQ